MVQPERLIFFFVYPISLYKYYSFMPQDLMRAKNQEQSWQMLHLYYDYTGIVDNGIP